MKKSCDRFTIKFNPEIASHAEAVQKLNDLGRKKASYLAEAIAFYSKNKDVSLGELNREMLENLIKQILLKQQNKGNQATESTVEEPSTNLKVMEKQLEAIVDKAPIKATNTTESSLEIAKEVTKARETPTEKLVEEAFSDIEIGTDEMAMLSAILGNFRS